MLESHYSEMFCESSLITPINQSFIAPILALYTETSCERLPMGIVQQWNLSWTATHTGVFFFLDSQKVLEETDPCINEMFGICFYDEAKLDCADLFDVTHWAMTRCYTLRASQLSHASATTSLRVIVNVNQPGYVVQRYKSAWLFLFRSTSWVVMQRDLL